MRWRGVTGLQACRAARLGMRLDHWRCDKFLGFKLCIRGV